MFVDISGYSLLAELDGDEAAADVALGLVEKAARLAAERDGEVVKCLGDGVMLHVSDAAEGVRLGLELLAAWDEDPSLPPIHLGLHTGPALERAGDWWGVTVNIASRVAAAAGAGQLLVTESARRAAGEIEATELRALGYLRLRNIASPTRVYTACRVGMPTLAGAGC